MSNENKAFKVQMYAIYTEPVSVNFIKIRDTINTNISKYEAAENALIDVKLTTNKKEQ